MKKKKTIFICFSNRVDRVKNKDDEQSSTRIEGATESERHMN